MLVAKTNIYDGKKSYVPGEIIENLNPEEEERLIKLNYAERIQSGKPVKNKSKGMGVSE